MQRARERQYSCCTKGEMWLCPRYYHQIITTYRSMKVADGIIIEVYDIRREASGRNMRDLYHGLNDTGYVAFKIDSHQGTDSLAKRNR